MSVLRPTLALDCIGVQTFVHQHRGWRAQSVASANGACARTPKPPAQRMYWRATSLISVGGGVCGRRPHSRLPTPLPTKPDVDAADLERQRQSPASVGRRTRTTPPASARSSPLNTNKPEWSAGRRSGCPFSGPRSRLTGLACRHWFINNVLANPVCGKREWGLRPDTQTTSQTAGLARYFAHLGGRWGLRAQAPFAVAHPFANQTRR